MGRTKETIIINDKVMLFNSKRKRIKGVSLSNRYLGPYIVTAITKGENFVLSELDGKKISGKQNRKMLRKYISRSGKLGHYLSSRIFLLSLQL